MKKYTFPKMEVPYVLSIWGGVWYYLSLALALALLLTRTNHAFWGSLPVVGRYPFYENVSNFSLSFMVMTAFGLAYLYQTHAWRTILMAASTLVFINIFVESFVTFLNTRDWKDAVAGIVGIAAALLFISMIERYCTRPKTSVKRKP